MAWVKRNDSGAIVSVFMHGPNADEGATEEIANDAQELLDFLNAPPAPPAPPTRLVSRRQFYTALALAGTITQAEALDGMAGNALPAALEAMVAAIPDATQEFIARGLLLSASDFKRDHPLVSSIGAAQGMTEQQIDNFFSTASQL